MNEIDYQNELRRLIELYGEQGAELYLAELAGYEKIPPTIEEFIESEYYCGSFLGKNLYPTWKTVLKEIYPNRFTSPYLQICVTGGVGLGKSTMCLVGVLYDLCKLLHLKNPHETFQMIPSDPIVVAFMNTTLKLADSNLVGQFKEWIRSSPFFSEQAGKIKQKKPSTILFPHNIQLVFGSRGTHMLGKAIVSGLLSELNYQGEHQKIQAYQQYEMVYRRQESRFKRGEGFIVPGRLWLDSSKSDETGFLEQHLKRAQLDAHSLIVSKAIWEIMGPAGKVQYSGKTFKVFVGDINRDPIILTEDCSHYNISESLVLNVPIEYYQSFDQDIYGALRDIAGVSTWSSFKFMPQAHKVREALTIINPCQKMEVELDFDDKDDKLIDYVDVSALSKKHPYFVHFDLGLKHDRTGVALTRSMGEVQVDRATATLETQLTQDLVYQTDLVLAVVPHPGKEVPIYKLKNFIVNLGYAGVSIGAVSADGYQSKNLLQDLQVLGTPTETVSVDRERDAYDLWKQAALEGRYTGPNHPILEREFLELLDLGSKGIDHPKIEGQFNKVDRPSKDLADAVVGSMWLCSQKSTGSKAVIGLHALVKHMAKSQTKPYNARDALKEAMKAAALEDRRKAWAGGTSYWNCYNKSSIW